MKNNFHKKIFLLFVIFLSLIFINSPGTHDVKEFIGWMDNIQRYGVVTAYKQTNGIYTPLSFIILNIVASFSSLFHANLFTGFKISLFIFLLFTYISFYFFTKNFLIASFLYLSLIISSLVLGYVDIYFTPFLILSLFALKKKRLTASVIFFTISFMIKQMSLMILPFFITYVCYFIGAKSKDEMFKQIFKVFFPSILLLIIIFSFFGKEIILAVKLGVISTNLLSANALNFYWLLSYVLHLLDPVTYGALQGGLVTYIHINFIFIYISKIVFLGLYLLIYYHFFRSKKTFPVFLIYSLLGYLTYFIFNTNVHENHLFLAIILSAALFAEDAKYLFTFLIWTLASNINLITFYGFGGAGLIYGRVIGGLDITVPFSALNVIFYIHCLINVIFKKIYISKNITN